ncbi:MAG: GH116 family glycosyl-hydrolase [Phycisphaeraceae bacterium]
MTIASSSVADGYVYQGETLREVAFPLGGIGAGCVSLEGRGALRDWEIFNCPNKGSFLPMTFPVLWSQAQGMPSQCRVVQGPAKHCFSGPVNEMGYGLRRHQGDGLPCFARAVFRNAFPLARIDFHHPASPLDVSLEAWSPFVPLDEDSSSFPLVCLTYRLSNPGKAAVRATLAMNLHNGVGFFPGPTATFDGEPEDLALNVFRQEAGLRGLYMTNARYPAQHPRFGSMALTTDWHDVIALPHWKQGHSLDVLAQFWSGFSTEGQLSDAGATIAPGPGICGTLGLCATVEPGQSVELPLVISWCFPNASKYWGAAADLPEPERPHWVNAYAKRWPTAWDAAAEFLARRAELTARTRAFSHALFDSTFPREVIESVANTASTLRSPTCLRLEDGTFWGWEGCSWISGACEGSCTHVWNYALTPAFLFPRLHRSMRRSEYSFGFDCGEQGRQGAIVFRIPLPLGTPATLKHAAVDGQLGGIVQLFRDWRICGDDDYLRTMWPSAQRALEYACVQWDRDRDGLIEGYQHNTYDIEFHGPNPLAQGFYLAALRAATLIATHLGQTDKATEYQRLLDSGQALTHKLFNGEYFEQALDCLAPAAPSHQHGKGCLSDQVFGQLAAHVAGLGYVLERPQVVAALCAVFKHNFKSPLGDHANPQRIYAAGDESGLILCSWPRGSRPALPFFYSDETWTGVEYQVATHMILEGLWDEGLAIVRGVRARHDGRRRNPFNEFECGSHYARAMSAWGLLLAISGFRFDAVEQTLWITPRGPAAQSMRSFFSTGTAWGVFEYHDDTITITIRVIEGHMTMRQVHTARGSIDLHDKPVHVSAGQSWTASLSSQGS